jgi:predicted AlkP superfamily phosphohydrolase/phosphomutase
MNPKSSVAVLLAIAVLAIAGFALLAEKTMTNPTNKNSAYKKVIIIGIDAMDPNVTNNLIERGLMPNFARLAREGSYAALATSLPPQTPVAFTSISTGTNPGKHGIYDFIRRDPKTYLPELALLQSSTGLSGTQYQPVVKADPFWRITSKAGIPTTVIRWPVTFPPEDVDGSMLSGLGVPDVKGFLSGYTFYTSRKVNPEDDSASKTVSVSYNDSIATSISGPRKLQGGDIVSITTPMAIQLDAGKKGATLRIGDASYHVNVGGWSDWMQVKFKVGFLSQASGICKAYLISAQPDFAMYLSTVQLDPENPLFPISTPKDYSANLAKNIGQYYTLGQSEDTDALTENVINDSVFMEQCNEIEAERDKMFWQEFDKFKKLDTGVLAFVYDTSDRVQHTHWDDKAIAGNGSKEVISQNIIDYYVKKDAFLGDVLSQLDNNTALFIVSDHGFTSFEREVSVNTWLARNGYLTLTTEIDEKDEGALFKYVDWNKTKAYSVGFNSIYINMEGREGQGIVKDGEKKQLMDEIIQKLENLTDAKTGKKLVAQVYKGSDVYTGPYANESPDLIIGFSPGYRMSWQTAVGGVTPDVVFDNVKKWDGDHLIDPTFVPGVIFTNFKFNNEKPDQKDVAPTLLKLLGLDIPASMDGKPLV